MFSFKQFSVDDANCGMKVGTDSVLLGSWVDVAGVKTAIDLGCGSGLLALMLAQRAPEARITAIDIDDGACTDAAANFKASPWPSRLYVVRCDALDFEPQCPPDLIICNPPYFCGGLVASERRRAKARTADDSGMGPADAIRLASRWLAPDGSLAMVTPADMAADIIFEAEMLRLDVRRQCAVVAVSGRQPTRMLWQMARHGRAPLLTAEPKSLITIRSDAAITEEYAALTREFYL